MFLHKLKIQNYGKFSDREFTFAPGCNVLYAPNETGKTTVLSTIHGLLYGFLRRDVKTKSFEEEHERYVSMGSFVAGDFVSDGERIHIERNLYDGDSKLFVDGVLSTNFPMQHKIYQYGESLLGVGASSFRSFFEIDTRRALTPEERTYFRFEEEGDVRYKRAIEHTEKILAKLGSERAPTKRRCILAREIESIEERLVQNEWIYRELDAIDTQLHQETEGVSLSSSKRKRTLANFVVIGFQIVVAMIFVMISIVLKQWMWLLVSAISIIMAFAYYFVRIAASEEEGENTERELIFARRDALLQQRQELEALRRRRDAKREELEEVIRQYDDYSIVRDALKCAAAGAEEDTLPTILRDAKEMYAYVTGRDELLFDESLQAVLVRDAYITASQVSTGTMELILFCLRFAFHKHYAQGEFLLLDDPFVYMDDERVHRVMQLLAREQDKQILLATSSKRVLDICRKEFIMVHEVIF